VLLGRGGGTNPHCGNVNFRKLVNKYKMRYYLADTRIEQATMTREVVDLWKNMVPPGRFLARKYDAEKDNKNTTDDYESRGEVVWIEVPEKKAHEKANQWLLETIADLLPWEAEDTTAAAAAAAAGTTITTSRNSLDPSPSGKRSPEVDNASTKRTKHGDPVGPACLTDDDSSRTAAGAIVHPREIIFRVPAAEYSDSYDFSLRQALKSIDGTCVQCESCEKCRFYCGMNWSDPEFASCCVPEEENLETWGAPKGAVQTHRSTSARAHDDNDSDDDDEHVPEVMKAPPQEDKGNSNSEIAQVPPPPPLAPIIPNHFDVLLAPRHGTDYRQYSGNMKLIVFILREQEKYHTSDLRRKTEIIKEAVQHVKLQNPPGR
jgi:hypothetical protein